MSTAEPDHSRPDQRVRVQVTVTVQQLNARGPMTAEAFEIFAADNGRCELLQGRVRMMSPAGFLHGRVTWRIGQILGNHVEQNGLGVVVAAETGFLLSRDPDTVRAADVAFLSSAAMQTVGDETGFVEIAPDLVVEVRSPSAREGEIVEKTEQWLAAGTRVVINADPKSRSVTVHCVDRPAEKFAESQILSGGEVLPDWTPNVSDLFL
jgi:Uma2 family endonuclease